VTVAVAVLVAAELLARWAVAWYIVERPARYRIANIDTKIDAFVTGYRHLSKEGKRRFLVLGSSNAGTNIDPARLAAGLERELGQPFIGFNAGIYAGRLSDMEFSLRWMTDREEFDHVLIMMDPWLMRYGRVEQLQERLSKPAIEQWLMRHSMLMALRNQAIFIKGPIDPYLRGLVALDRETTIYGWNRTVMAFSPARVDPLAQAQSQARSLIYPLYDPPGPYVPDRKLLLATAEEARRRGLTVHWMISPQRPVIEPFLPEHHRRQDRQALLHELAAAAGTTPLDLTDMQDDGRIDEGDWFDSSHMNPRGAARLSEELARRWAEALRRDGCLDGK
jgi:hypothetical protein